MLKNLIKNNNITLILATLLVTAACSLTPADKATADEVDQVMAEFSHLEKSGGGTGQEWFDLAKSARTSNRLDIAAQALNRAAAAGFSPVGIGAEKSRQRIVAGAPDAAVAEIQGLLDQGFTSVAFFTNDPIINSLAGNAGYDAVIAAMTVQAYPCANQEGFSDFDFWIGGWDVHVANGTLVGTNSITREERGCVLIEHWTNSTGGTGMSINYLDKITDEWVQVWNAEGGSQINVRGGLTDAGMAMKGTLHTVSNGTTVPFRALWTLLPDGRVRQYFEQSNDDGATWVPWFEGFYTRQVQ